ncbi:MAG: beta-L-arabinofuranosidase domain-containing protein [Flexilinea sp.]
MMNKAFTKLNITEIHPTGWLLRQLQIQMNGLTGALYDIWDSVGSYSGWLGGTGESWERAPYYLDGLLPLSYYLNDSSHWDLCMRFIEWTLRSQIENGNFGPQGTREDYWSRYVMLKVLIQYYEITKDRRVLPFARKYFGYVADEIKQRPLTSWSKVRVPDLLYCMKWVYEKTGDETIPDLAKQIDLQSLDWNDYFESFPFPRPAASYFNWQKISKMNWDEFDKTVPFQATHIVNITMGFKHPAMKYFFTGDERYRALAKKGIDELVQYHGVASGCINGDEHLAGNNPNQGSELCSVVEYMFSLATMTEVFGEPYMGDLIEKLAYNALPATITADFWGHQYLQQANQVLATKEPRPWFNNDDTSNIFGLEPNFGCCTANMHQGWPKFVNALWYKENDDTLVSMVFAPSVVSTTIGGEPVSIELKTDYPFRDTLTYVFQKVRSQEMALKIRIPEWCESPSVSCPGANIVLSAEKHMIEITKIFAENDEISVTFPMPVVYSHWYKDSAAVERGPLLYGLDIRERWEVLREIMGVKDYCVYPESPWNYAIRNEGEAVVEETEVPNVPFSKDHPAVRLKIRGKQLDSWKLDHGDAGDLPQSPVAPDSKEEEVSMIPFGCTKLRIAQFPYYR